jgi:hypothetical protein
MNLKHHLPNERTTNCVKVEREREKEKNIVVFDS